MAQGLHFAESRASIVGNEAPVWQHDGGKDSRIIGYRVDICGLFQCGNRIFVADISGFIIRFTVG